MWLGSQMPTQDQKAAAKVFGVKQEKVKLNTMLAGGSFGRLATPNSHFATEAANVGKAWGKSPVKHAWTRENDIRGGYYRPLSVHKLRGGLDAFGKIVAWDHVMAIQSFFAGTPMEPMMIKNGIDEGAVEGATKLPYAIPDQRVGLHVMKNGVPTLWWRSVGNTHTAYVVQTFLDELLTAGGQDPVKGRLALLKPDDQRYHGVLNRVAEMAAWSGPKAADGRTRGVALHKSFDSYVAQIAEVSRGEDGLPRVHKVWCAVDCGVAVNPDVIRAQMEGCIGFGLGAILYSEVNLGKDGVVEEGNFNTYRTLRINEMPDVEVAIIKSGADPTGVGEPGLPPIGPAVANAWRALTKQSVRQLPFARSIKA
jgi:isoquinoline 1-oxidoreductase beta subunit